MASPTLGTKTGSDHMTFTSLVSSELQLLFTVFNFPVSLCLQDGQSAAAAAAAAAFVVAAAFSLVHLDRRRKYIK